jgi:hypothetical protein
MRYETRISAYDVLDHVCVAITLKDTDGLTADAGDVVYHRVTTVPGVGEDRPLEWLRDVLVAALETL